MKSFHLSEMGAEDWGIFFLNCLASIMPGVLLGMGFAILVGIFLHKRIGVAVSQIFTTALIIILGDGIGYLLVSGHEILTMTCLDSEDDHLAEAAYHGLFDASLDRAIALSVNIHTRGNLRFYAACRVADLLTTNDDETISRTMERVKRGSVIRPDFFSTNDLTFGMIVPGTEEGPFRAENLVKERLKRLGRLKS